MFPFFLTGDQKCPNYERDTSRFITLPNAQRITFLQEDSKDPQLILVLDKHLIDKEWKDLPERTNLSLEQTKFNFETLHMHPALVFVHANIGKQWYSTLHMKKNKEVMENSVLQRRAYFRSPQRTFFGSGVGIGQRTVQGRVENGWVFV